MGTLLRWQACRVGRREVMIWLLQMLILGHVHKWKEVDRKQISRYNKYMKQTVQVGDRIEYLCEKCGKRKIEDLT
jgi:hypothetical protein